MFSDEVDKTLDCLSLGYIETHRGFADIEVDFTGSASNIAEISISHFARAIDDAAHDGNFDTLEVIGAGTDVSGYFLQIKQSATATRTCDVVSLERATTGGLQNVVSQAK